MEPERLEISLQEGEFVAEVLRAGQGEPLVYLHGMVVRKEWAPFLDRLSGHFNVYAPYHPGYSQSRGLEHIDGVLDLALYYFDLLDALGIGEAYVVGHSLGGMVAAEMAALCRHYVKKLVMVGAAGLWRDDEPTLDFLAMTPQDLELALWADPGSAAATQAMAQPDSEEARDHLALDRIQDLTAAAKFLWPIPDKGLKKRLHRIESPTLILWGKQDRIIPAVYAEDFSQRISGSRLDVPPHWGHLPMLEHPEEFAGKVVEFLEE